MGGDRWVAGADVWRETERGGAEEYNRQERCKVCLGCAVPPSRSEQSCTIMSTRARWGRTRMCVLRISPLWSALWRVVIRVRDITVILLPCGLCPRHAGRMSVRRTLGVMRAELDLEKKKK